MDPLIELAEPARDRIKTRETEVKEQFDVVRQACAADIANAQRTFSGYFDLHRDSLRYADEQVKATMREAENLSAQVLFNSHAIEYRAIVRDPVVLQPILARLRERLISEFGEHVRRGVQHMETGQIKEAKAESKAESEAVAAAARRDEMLPKRASISADFWRSRRRQFVKLGERQEKALKSETHEKWLKGYCFGAGEPVRGGLDGTLISDFEDLVTQAAYALGCPEGNDPIEFWVQSLASDLRNARNREVRKELFAGHGSGGIIQDLIKSSAGFCSRLAAKAEREANISPSQSRRGPVDPPPDSEATNPPQQFEETDPVLVAPSNGDPFVCAYEKIAASSEVVQAAINRKFTAPTKRVAYQDLEQTIWQMWQVRPDDVTANHLRHALYLLAKQSEGGVELNRISCEAYGIDYDRLMPLIRPSPVTAEDMTAGPKVPRKPAPGTVMNAKPTGEAETPVDTTGAQPGRENAIPATSTPSKKRGRPATIDTAKKEAALAARERGESWRDAAKLLYASTYPSAQQVKNAPNVLKNYKLTRVPPPNKS